VIDWLIEHDHFLLRNGPSPTRKRTRFPSFPLIKNKAANWALEQSDAGLVVTNCDLKGKILEIAQRDDVAGLRSSSKWISKLKKGKDLASRLFTQITQKTEFSERDLARVRCLLITASLCCLIN
jgi:hypothetical protein